MTHEQADFDAIASLAAASLLQKEAHAVLPKKLNRNVKIFLELYGGEFFFNQQEDLPQGKIAKVTLVDTQSLVTIKGMGKNIAVQVIDHHQIKDKIPDTWEIIYEQTGANTTILIEEIRAHQLRLNSIQATLLLLGIYEDTGSLSYAATTYRDALAVAFLLEQGASLKIANTYLNPSLSPDQEVIYQRLMDHNRLYDISDLRILISSADARDLNEEISSIAHKIRDLLDPDGLFLIVETNEGIRLLARSSNDRIPVNVIAEYFGGGGHQRAAAALIPHHQSDKSIPEITEELLSLLQKTIEPAITIDQIMSKNPLLITPQTGVQTAANLMQRYGYEGYPVVDDHKIVGLLTRRAVDRALTHKINKKTGSLMKVGCYYVYTNDSIDTLQKVMTNSGWGQIPVLSPHNQQIVGIVTRTDLLNAIGKPSTFVPGKKNLTDLLNQSLPSGRIAFIQFLADLADQQKIPIYIVGGFVRDLLLNRPSMDFDIVVEGDAINFAVEIQKNFGGKLHTHKRFGTAKWDIQAIKAALIQKAQFIDAVHLDDLPDSLDLISARTEFYDFPTALPKIEKSSIKLDLHRRDFSINTLALRLDGKHYGELYDFWGGLEDIQRGLIRVLHSLSFVDDPTRMIRAVRFEQRFEFSIENRTHQLMEEALELVDQVSGDRLRHELNLLFMEDQPKPAFLRLEDLGLLNSIYPRLTINSEMIDLIQEKAKLVPPKTWLIPDSNGDMPSQIARAYILWFSQLNLPAADLCKRLRMQALIPESVVKTKEVINQINDLVGKPISTIYAFLAIYPNLVLYCASLLITNSQEKQLIEEYLTTWQHVKSFISGHDLRDLGIQPGPHYKLILANLKAAHLDGNITTLAEEQEIIKQFLQENPGIV